MFWQPSKQGSGEGVSLLPLCSVVCQAVSLSFRVILPLLREDDHKKLLAQVDVWQHAEKATPKVFCGIFTHHPNHSTQVKVRAP